MRAAQWWAGSVLLAACWLISGAIEAGELEMASDPSSAPGGPQRGPKVTFGGRLAPRYEGNVRYLLDIHDRHGPFMIDAYRLREKRKKEA